MDLWLRLSFEHEVIRSNASQLSHHGEHWSQQCAVSTVLQMVWSQANRAANKDVSVVRCVMRRVVLNVTSEKAAARQPETCSENRPLVFIQPCARSDFRDTRGWIDTERNFLSCGIIRKTTESFTVLLQQLKFNNGAADKIVELLVAQPNADVRRFSAARGENDRWGRVQRGCSAGQTAKKVFLIEWQRGVALISLLRLFLA